jgi:hypothetical protein
MAGWVLSIRAQSQIQLLSRSRSLSLFKEERESPANFMLKQPPALFYYRRKFEETYR